MVAQLVVLGEREVAAVLAAGRLALDQHVRMRAHLAARSVGPLLVRRCAGGAWGVRGGRVGVWGGGQRAEGAPSP